MTVTAPKHKHEVIPPRWRDYLYPIALTVVALLGSYGVIEGEQVAVWGALAAAVLGVGTATAYRPSRTLPDDPHE